MKILKSYKYRIYPNKQQETLIQKTFGCCRFVYNQTLAYRIELYKTQGKSLSKYGCEAYMIHNLKTKHKWLFVSQSRRNQVVVGLRCRAIAYAVGNIAAEQQIFVAAHRRIRF